MRHSGAARLRDAILPRVNLASQYPRHPLCGDGCCAYAANGPAATAPPGIAMNSRRSLGPPLQDVRVRDPTMTDANDTYWRATSQGGAKRPDATASGGVPTTSNAHAVQRWWARRKSA